MPELSEIPGVGPAKAAILEEKGIQTVEQLSIMDPEELKVTINCSLAAAKKMIKGAKDLTQESVKLVTGEEEKQERKAKIQYISTGSQSLDNLFLGGQGIPTDAVTAFYGQFAAGKTQLCNMLAVNMKKQYNRKTVWIETEPQTLILERIEEIAKANGITYDLKDLIVASAKYMDTPTHMFKVYEGIEDKLKQGVDIGLIVIDSFNALFRSTYVGRETLGPRSAEQGRHIGYLQKLASKYNIAVVLTLQIMGIPDSFGWYSPVMIRDKDGVDIIPIENVWNNSNCKAELADNGREVKQVYGMRVLSVNNLWSDIKSVHRHKYKGELIRINATCGLVDSSPNHSVYKNTKLVDVNSLKVGDSVNPQYYSNVISSEMGMFVGEEDLAWLYGFFSTNGSIYTMEKHDRPYGNRLSYNVTFNSYDNKTLYKIKDIITKYFRVKSYIGCHKLKVYNKKLYEFLKDNFYCSNKTTMKYRKVPKFILNADKRIKLAYLKGYNKDKDFINSQKGISTTSHVLAAGLIYLIQSTTKQSFTVYNKDTEDTSITITFNKNKSNERIKPGLINRINSIKYNGYLYDIETESHKFKTGIGLITARNSGSQLGAIKKYGIATPPSASHVLKHGVNYMIGLDQISSVDKTWKAIVADGPVPRGESIFCITEEGVSEFAKRRG